MYFDILNMRFVHILLASDVVFEMNRPLFTVLQVHFEDQFFGCFLSAVPQFQA